MRLFTEQKNIKFTIFYSNSIMLIGCWEGR